MASKTVQVFTCDLCGAEAVETVTFDKRELDLCKKDHAAYAKALKPYMAASRTARIVRGSKAPSRASQGHTQEVRDWANSNGFTVGNRGRIASTVMDAYNKAHA